MWLNLKTICIVHELEADPELDIYYWQESVQTNMLLRNIWLEKCALQPFLKINATFCDISLFLPMAFVHFKGGLSIQIHFRASVCELLDLW